jgi:hypothetical protein
MLTPAGGGPARALQLAARESREIDLAAGEYGIEQTALNGNTGSDSRRQFTIRLEPGQTYRWKLLTLLSAPVDGSGDPASNDHER